MSWFLVILDSSRELVRCESCVSYLSLMSYPSQLPFPCRGMAHPGSLMEATVLLVATSMAYWFPLLNNSSTIVGGWSKSESKNLVFGRMACLTAYIIIFVLKL